MKYGVLSFTALGSDVETPADEVGEVVVEDAAIAVSLDEGLDEPLGEVLEAAEIYGTKAKSARRNSILRLLMRTILNNISSVDFFSQLPTRERKTACEK